MDYRRALRLTMADFKLKQIDLAEKAGVKYQAISQYKNGHTDLRVSTLEAIINAMPPEARENFYRLVRGKETETLVSGGSTSPEK